MRISISKDDTFGFKTVDVNTVDEIVKAVTSSNWSCSVFKNGHRKLENFISADCIAFDIDNKGTNINIELARDLFSQYKHLILPTQSHRINKTGQGVADRYRVIIPFEKTITDPDEYYGTWQKFYERFDFIDKACKDPSRYWKPSTGLFNARWNDGECAIGIKPTKKQETVQVVTGLRGTLTRKTLNFLINGAEAGTWNVNLFEAALDFKSQGYSLDEAMERLSIPCRMSLGNDGELDETDIESIKSAYNEDTRHDKRGPVKVFNFQRVGELINNNEKMEWLVDGLLSVGGMSIIAGAPKSGKSTIIRQLGKAIAQGTDFLGRKCKQGGVLYLALEEQRSLLSQQLRQLGVKSEDPFFIHCGPVFNPNKADALYDFAIEQRPALIVIDTLILFANGKDINNYNEMYEILSFFRELARDTGSHVTFVHHQNKSQAGGTNSIMGSSAIHGAVDNAMIFCNVNGVRKLTTSQRGGVPFENHPLEFDYETQTYILGVKDEF
jgi:hypothetical protein